MPKIRDIPAGSLFEYLPGHYAVKSEYKLRPCEPGSPYECIIVGSGEYYHGNNGDDDEVRVVELDSMRPSLENLRCPECGERVFFATICPPGWVLCREVGHWAGPMEECTRSTQSRKHVIEQELKRLRNEVQNFQHIADDFFKRTLGA